MLAIRFQRIGRRNQPKFRVVVQDSRRTPTSGRVVANLGHYNPHTKEHGVDFDRLQIYLRHGAQPSPRVVHLLVSHKIELPSWVKTLSQRQRSTRHPDKLRRNRPAEAAVTEPTPEPEAKAEEATKAEVSSTENSDEVSDAPATDNQEPAPADDSNEQSPPTVETSTKTDEVEAKKDVKAHKTKVKTPKGSDPEEDQEAEADSVDAGDGEANKTKPNNSAKVQDGDPESPAEKK